MNLFQSYEYVVPVSYLISVRVFEDERYVPSYKVSLVMEVLLGETERESNLILDTGIFTDSLEQSVHKALVHGYHLFKIMPEPVVHIIDPYGNLDTNRTLFDIIGGIDDIFE